MNDVAHVAAGRSSPGLRYRNVDAAIKWLCEAFGFELRSVEVGRNGRAEYAELSFGSTIIMVGAVRGFDIDRFMKQPDDIGGAETQCCYYVVDDLDSHYVRARRAGCKIVIDLQTRPNGARAFTCRDPEGHLWCFGTYDPWQNLSIAPARPEPAAEIEAPSRTIAATVHHGPKFPARLAAGLSMGAIVSGIVAAWIYGEAWQTSREVAAAPAALIGPQRVIGTELSKEMFQRAIKDARLRLAFERRIRRAAERASKAARAEVVQERRLRVSAEQTAKELAARLALARQAADRAQAAASTAEENLAKERSAKSDGRSRLAREAEAARRAAEDARAELAREVEQAHKTAKHAHAELTRKVAEANRAAKDAQAELAKAQRAKAAAEHEAKQARIRLTFVSHNARESTEQAVADIRNQMKDEKAAREAAEREAEQARAELARERSLKVAAWHTVEQLRQRLATAGSKKVTVARRARRRRARVVRRRRPTVVQAPATQKTAGWDLHRGPVFYKDTGTP